MAGKRLELEAKIDLRRLFADLKEFDPKLAREVRKRLRDSGALTIEQMRKAIDKPFESPPSDRPRGLRTTSTGARDKIKRGLKVNIVAGKSRQAIRISTSGKPLHRAWESKTWRQPVFGRDTWIERKGVPYFNKTVYDGADAMREQILAALEDAIKVLSDK